MKLSDLSLQSDYYNDNKKISDDNLTVKANGGPSTGLKSAIRELEEKIKKSVANEEKTFSSIMSQITTIEQKMNQLKCCQEISNEEFRKEVKSTENAIKIQLSVTLNEFEEAEREEISCFDNNVQKMNNELIYENSSRDSKIRELIGQLADRLSFVQGELHSERRNREDIYDSLINRIGNEILRVDKLLHQERKTREEGHAELMKLINDTYNVFVSEIDV